MSTQLAARAIAILFLISTSSYTIADSLSYEFLVAPDFLNQVAQNSWSLSLASLLEFLNCAAVVGISVLLYPIIKQYNERVAIGYLAGRIIEAATLLPAAVILITLTAMGEKMLAGSIEQFEQLYVMGTALKHERFATFSMGMLSLSVAGFFLNITLFKYRIIPRLLSGLGLVGYATLLLKVVFDFLDVSISGTWMYIPGGLFEFLLPIWLLFKGFDLSHKPNPQSC
ncbi:DUF4386 domain-containing protein [Pseudoalteromonas sp. JBTF-M23]|uniref:DUF4386 domain-containing protein n=1 Tax=Pseudoalteromonas caenipelagi TaxID=2726988 RepID=A0A849VB33_9GAMM|nr:DUF4386 domain-containing protein [Pseudoalteromonas caenipelagi]NOU49813.1 DUF4386 domain-containing protein [Pseudoalteromonas caenipelagi]